MKRPVLYKITVEDLNEGKGQLINTIVLHISDGTKHSYLLHHLTPPLTLYRDTVVERRVKKQ
jgi:hypothetical protein